MTRQPLNRLLLPAAAAFVLACGGPAPSATPGPSGSPSPTPGGSGQEVNVTSPAQAATLVMASDPRFASLSPANSELIGGCCFYEAVEAPPGYQVTIELGWGDCPSGCINHHKWQFHVDPDGTISLIDESGDEPVAVNPVGEQRPANVVVHMRAGPTCPAEPVPPQPGCEPRPVANANLIVRDAQGTELATATSDEQGQVVLRLPAGAYYVEPQPVEGLLGTAAPVAFSVVGGDSLDINVDYDTGIR